MKNEALKKAFDNATLTGKLVELNEEQATEFIQMVKNESTFLKLIRLVPMSRPNKDIAKMFANGRFLHPGKSGVLLSDSKYQKFGSDIVTLSTQLVRGAFFVTDEEVQDNIEGGKVTDSFVSMISAKVGNELEEIGIYSRDAGLGEDAPTTLYQFKGWKKAILDAGNVVDANSVAFPNRKVAKNKFSKALKSIATQYRQGLVFAMPADVVIDYKLLFDTVADQAVRGELTSVIFNKPYVEVPLMKVDEPVVKSGGFSTTVSSALTANGTLNVIPFTSATGVNVGEHFAVALGSDVQQVFTVVSIATNNITVDRPIDINIANGATITEVTLDGADVILSNPKNFLYGIQTSQMSFETERVASLGWKYHWKMRIDFKVENAEACAIITNLLADE